MFTINTHRKFSARVIIALRIIELIFKLVSTLCVFTVGDTAGGFVTEVALV